MPLLSEREVRTRLADYLAGRLPLDEAPPVAHVIRGWDLGFDLMGALAGADERGDPLQEVVEVGEPPADVVGLEHGAVAGDQGVRVVFEDAVQHLLEALDLARL